MLHATRHHIFETAHGFAAIGWKPSGIASFRLPASSAAQAERALLRRLPASERADPPENIGAIVAAARRYFMGGQEDFSSVVIDLGDQTPFFTRIYAWVRQLGWGETTTYGAVARALGAGPEAARTVGEAMASNPVPLIIPCHRVTAAGGRIGGFSAPGGSASKAHMLELEGVIPASVDAPQMGFDF